MPESANWKALCQELVHDLEDWHIAFGHEAVYEAANQTFDRIERVKTALNADTDSAIRPFSDLTKDFDAERRDRINARKQQLTEWSLKSFLDKYKDPVLARQFLMDAGLIDENGDLSKHYKS